MNPQQIELWKKITNQVRKAGLDNMYARELYDKLCKFLNMANDKVILSITETERGLEVRIHEEAYGNIALVGLLEKLKMNILLDEDSETITKKVKTGKKYDA